MMFPAHIKTDDNGNEIIQSVEEHCCKTADYAGESLRPAGLFHAGYLAGLLHDMGKLREEFAEYIKKASKGVNVRRGSVVHTFQGCRFILDSYHGNSNSLGFTDITAELIAYGIGAHHGLFDCCGPWSDEHGFHHRMNSKETGFEETVNHAFKAIGNKEEIDTLFAEAERECAASFGKIQQMLNARVIKRDDPTRILTQDFLQKELSFYLGMEARTILSAVIEGDRRDTREFMEGVSYPAYGVSGDSTEFWNKYLDYMEKKLIEFPQDTPIQRARRIISDKCMQFAVRETGVYRLNVPTGAGKTLSSLRFALKHAAVNSKRRIIFTAPLLSILDQNAQIIKEFLGDDSIVLEHYSSITDDLSATRGSKTQEAWKRNENSISENKDLTELLTDSWDAPVIITSMVQLLQTLFSGRTSSIRRFQALCGSVIVIDEVQTVPNKMLSLFNLAVNYLSEICDVTFLLCSATQPYLEGAAHPLIGEPEDVVPYNKNLWQPFLRTRIIETPGKRLENLPDFVLDRAEQTSSLLVVCNKKTEAEYLFEKVREAGKNCYHLSASMCMAHRKKVLNEIIQALGNREGMHEPVICITTQVIEAGVDISFESVIRLAAGVDNIVQAAGRCNRNGERAIADVYVVDCVDENLSKLQEIRRGKNALQEMMIAYKSNPSAYGDSWMSEEAIQCYYQKLYESMPKEYQDYMLDEKGGLKGVSILSLLSDNAGYNDRERKDHGSFVLNQAFYEAGQNFRVFEDDAEDVIVPYADGKELICELEDIQNEKGFDFAAHLDDWLQRAKPYTVSLYSYQMKGLEQSGGIYEMAGIKILQEGHYDMETGVCNDSGNDFII